MPRDLSSRRRSLSISGAVIALFLLIGASCSDSSDVTLATVAHGTVTELVDAPASVLARAVSTLSAPADGTLTKLTVRAGQAVAKGQVLAVIDSPSATARLAQAKSALAATKKGRISTRGLDLTGFAAQTDASAAAAFAQAQAAIDALPAGELKDHLQASLAASRKQYDAAAASAKKLVQSVNRGVASAASAVNALASASQTQAQAAYDVAKSTVDALTLRAPIAGTVQLGGTSGASQTPSALTDLLGAAGGLAGAVPTSTDTGVSGVDQLPVVGGPVSAGTAVVTVVDASRLTLLAEVDETDVLLVSVGIAATVELDAAPGAGYSGKVTSVDLLPTPSGRGGVSYRVRLDLAAGKMPDGSAAPQPRPGMSAVAHLAVRESKDVLTVPAAALITASGADAVWRVVNGKAVLTPVNLGVQGTDEVEVANGLAAGDQVVVAGADKVHAGQRLP